MSDPATMATEDYLARLDRAAVAGGLDAAARAELRSRTAEWIADRRADAVEAGREPLRAVLDALAGFGSPEELLAEARASGVGDHAHASQRLTATERAAVIGLGVGWATAGIGWVVGVIALARCARWRLPEKLGAALATLVLPSLAVRAGTSGTDPSLVNVGGFALLIVLSTAAPLLLVWRLRRRGGMPV